MRELLTFSSSKKMMAFSKVNRVFTHNGNELDTATAIMAYSHKNCIWTGETLHGNSWFYKYTKGSRKLVFQYLLQLIKNKFINEYIINDILDYLLPKSYAPPLFMYFEYNSFLGELLRNVESQKNIKDKDYVNNYKTKFGRKIVAPDRFQNKKFLKGSGDAGCDHYDRGFAGKNHGDYGSKLWEKESKIAKYEKNNFVVDDDVSDEYGYSSEDYEDVWDSGDETEEDLDYEDCFEDDE